MKICPNNKNPKRKKEKKKKPIKLTVVPPDIAKH